MRNSLLLFGAAVLSTYLFGCATERIYLHPVDHGTDKTFWYSGEEFQVKTGNNVTAYAAFENEYYNTVTFYIAVENAGPDTLLVAPEAFYYHGAYRKVKIEETYSDLATGSTYRIDTANVADTAYAISPEGHGISNLETGSRIGYNSGVGQLNNEMNRWMNVALRKTTLLPHTAVAGKVSFPVVSNLRTLKLMVPIGETIFEFDFEKHR